MSTLRPTLLSLALLAAFPAMAQSNADILKELQALRARVAELEAKVQAADAKTPQWGMTPEQVREFNRVTIKTEAMEDSRDAAGFKGLKIAGYMDPSWIYNKARNRAAFQFINSVAGDGYNYDNSYFGTAAIDFTKETESGTRWRLTLVPNRGTDAVIGNGNVVQEASVSIPLGDLQTRMIAGHLPDWSGYEYLPATQNKLITHNLLFDFTLPTSYSGIGMELTRGKWLMKGMLANINAARGQDGQKAPAVVYRVDYAKGEFDGFGFAGAHGKVANFADPNGVPSRVNLFEVDGYFIRGDLTLQGQLSIGGQKGAAIAPDPVDGSLRDARWSGLSMLAAYKFTPRFEGTARFDMVRNRKNGGGLLGYTGFWDPYNGSLGDNRNGIGVDATQDCLTDATIAACNQGVNRSALSLGMGYALDLNTSLRFEYRLDRANAPIFFNVRDGLFTRSNTLLGASVLVSF